MTVVLLKLCVDPDKVFKAKEGRQGNSRQGDSLMTKSLEW